MIPCNPGSEHPLRWKKIFADSHIGLKKLLQYYPAIASDESRLKQIDALFPVQLTQQMLESHRADSAVLRQYLPDAQELKNTSEDSNDPVGDLEASQLPGVIHKYSHRALIITSNTCPIHCRYCFRKNFPYPESSPNSHLFRPAIDYCRRDNTLHEVILSGGDPLSLEDSMLKYLFNSFEEIPHIKTIRLHTKYPSIFPQRVTPEFLNILNDSTLNKVLVFHINHPEEVTKEFTDVARKIRQTQTTTLNQSVLLNKVNNNAETLIELSRRLFDAGVLPYYLHMLDHAKGTHHFQVSDQQAQSIVKHMKECLPGYLVPKLAREIAGQASKIY